MACLDTTFFIDLKGRSGSPLVRRAEAILEQLQATEEHAVTTRFNVAELYAGAIRSSRPERELSFIESILEDFEILEFDAAAAEEFGNLKSHVLNIGRPTGDMDLLIGAVAKINGEHVVTRNPRHFAQMPGVGVVTC